MGKLYLDALSGLSLPDVLELPDGKIDSKLFWNQRRQEILELLGREIYGFSPPPPGKVASKLLQRDEDAFAGKAVHSVVRIIFNTPRGEFSFPVNTIIPKNTSSVPLFIHISFRPDVPDMYYPAEEILDAGFACVTFYYEDIVPDKEDGFLGGLAGMYHNGCRKPDEWGKISMWAWAASRVMDYVQTLDEIHKRRIAVIGHSRLGKTALWCAAQDARFAFGISNNSGCSGAALTRGKKGERVKAITDNFSCWFCDNYKKYRDNEDKMPFDQHFVLAAIAPRRVYVSSAAEDEWADPIAEFLGCAAASPAYELLGLDGFVTSDGYPEPGTILHEGEIGYHLRAGTHYLSRYDWQQFIKYMKVHSCT